MKVRTIAKILSLLSLPVVLLFVSCSSTSPQGSTASVQPIRSIREDSERTEEIATSMLANGQAQSIDEARNMAGMIVNQEWAASVKAAEKQRKQEEFERNLYLSKKDPFQ